MEKIKNWFHKPVFTLVCYLIAVLVFAYFAYSIKTSYDYIASLVSQGSVTWGGNIADIFGYFVSNTFGYFYYGFAFVFFGKVVNILKPKATKDSDSEIANDFEEEE